MHRTIKPKLTSDFEREVYEGLTNYPKHLSSKYIYDKAGDKLFQDIMAMPEYYLTDMEFNILEKNKQEIAGLFSKNKKPFHLIELGAGDGKKTKILLHHFIEKGIDFTFRPIDISQNALDSLKSNLKKEIPKLRTEPLQGTYFETLKNLDIHTDERKIILFLGSNIGNLLHEQAVDFLSQIQGFMQPDDLLFIGFDLKKNPQTILNAYNDKAGITSAFNKNILVRINKELNSNFDIPNFLHWEVYDPETGTAKSYLVSKISQTVRVADLDLNLKFDAWETIHTEISQKYDYTTIDWLSQKAGLEEIAKFTDDQRYYSNYLFTKR